MTPTTPRRLRLPWAAIVAVACLAGEARAHVPEPVEMSARVDAEAVRIHLRVMEDVFLAWSGVDVAAVAAGGASAQRDARRVVDERVAPWLRVEVDRVPVRAVVESVEPKTWSDHGLTRTYTVVTLAYGAKGEPREVSVAWTHFEGVGEWSFEELETEVEGFGETTYFRLDPREPELVWHRPRARVVEDVPVPRPEGRRREVVVSLPGLLLAAALLAGLAASLRVRALRRPAWALALAAGAVGLGAARVAPVAIPLPGSSGPERPDPEAAKALFEGLLRNVYRAFDHDREDAIYDTLAHTVSGPLLDRVYEEVYASLVMREQGGAVSKVERVEVLDQEVSPPPDATDPSFLVRCRWRVHGKVGHWGHTHERVNEHEALYTVTPEGDRWKIAAMKVLSQVRVDDGRGR